MGGPIAMLEPAIADLSETLEEWWSELSQAVQAWYGEQMKLSPLECTGHKPVPSIFNNDNGSPWSRVASMLLKAVPDDQKEELVAGKSMGAFAIMAHLDCTNRGGLCETETILKNVEKPPEASSLQEGVVQLRRWTKWRLRAKAEPPGFRLVRKILETRWQDPL